MGPMAKPDRDENNFGRRMRARAAECIRDASDFSSVRRFLFSAIHTPKQSKICHESSIYPLNTALR
jgi:hypothetical protein